MERDAENSAPAAAAASEVAPAASSAAAAMRELGDGGPHPQKLVDEFFDRHSDMAFEAQTLSNFVRKDPHFCDPRFLAEFFQRIKDDNGEQLIQGAKKLVDVCDHSSHQLNLLKPEAYTRDKLQSDLSDILGCIRNIREVLQIPAEVAQSEEKALQELQSMLPHYLRWRSRQLVAMQKLPAEMGGPGINKVAKETVASLLHRLDGKGTLAALDEKDNSQGVLVELLRHVSELLRQRRKVAVDKGGKRSAAAAAAKASVAPGPTRSELDGKGLEELRALCKAAKLSPKGGKDAVVRRLLEHHATAASKPNYFSIFSTEEETS